VLQNIRSYGNDVQKSIVPSSTCQNVATHMRLMQQTEDVENVWYNFML